MDKLKTLEQLISAKKALLEKEESPERIAELSDEILELSEQKGELKAQIAFEEKQKKDQEEAEEKAAKEERAEAKAHTKMAAGIPGPQKIEVVTPEQYKGYNFKAELDYCLRNPNMHAGIQSRMKENEEKAQGMVKLWIDLIDRAYRNPQGPAATKAAMQEGSTSEGGYLVPTEQRPELLAYMRDESLALRDCTIIPMASNSMTLPRELTKVSVTYSAEEEDATESEPTFNQVTLTARRMDAYAVSSNELIQDTNIPGGIVGILMSQFNEAVAQKVDSTVFIGSGADSAVFSGVFLTTGYSEVFESGSTHFSELLESNIRNLIGAIPERYIRSGAKWYIHKTPLWQYVRGLKDDNGNYMFAESKYGRAAPDMLWGYPVEKPTQAISTSAADTAMAVFGDLKGVWIGERLTNIDLMVDPYTGAKSYQTYWYLFTRWGYAHALPNKLGRIVTGSAG